MGFRRETRPNSPVHLSVWVDEFLKTNFPTRREIRQNASRIQNYTGFQGRVLGENALIRLELERKQNTFWKQNGAEKKGEAF